MRGKHISVGTGITGSAADRTALPALAQGMIAQRQRPSGACRLQEQGWLREEGAAQRTGECAPRACASARHRHSQQRAHRHPREELRRTLLRRGNDLAADARANRDNWCYFALYQACRTFSGRSTARSPPESSHSDCTPRPTPPHHLLGSLCLWCIQ